MFSRTFLQIILDVHCTLHWVFWPWVFSKVYKKQICFNGHKMAKSSPIFKNATALKSLYPIFQVTSYGRQSYLTVFTCNDNTLPRFVTAGSPCLSTPMGAWTSTSPLCPGAPETWIATTPCLTTTGDTLTQISPIKGVEARAEDWTMTARSASSNLPSAPRHSTLLPLAVPTSLWSQCQWQFLTRSNLNLRHWVRT